MHPVARPQPGVARYADAKAWASFATRWSRVLKAEELGEPKAAKVAIEELVHKQEWRPNRGITPIPRAELRLLHEYHEPVGRRVRL